MHRVFNSVNDGFKALVQMFHYKDHVLAVTPYVDFLETDSRNGKVISVREPVLITYRNPLDRVLYNPKRDANPFFHLCEAIWMLSGSNELAPVEWFVSRLADFSDDGNTLHGAYGYRWRHALGFDQLESIIDELSTDPNSRRCVLQMWDGGVAGMNDLYLARTGGKDVPCNTAVKFRTVPVKGGSMALDMVVENRSNDLIWGCLGANYVHFSFLQEYVATAIGALVGRYYHFTSNLHVYKWNWKPEEWLAYDTSNDPLYTPNSTVPLYAYGSPSDRLRFDEEIIEFVSRYDHACDLTWNSPFLETVLSPVVESYRYWKDRNLEYAIDAAAKIADRHWRHACIEWLKRRIK